MGADYECPKCHNILRMENKIFHDARCNGENNIRFFNQLGIPRISQRRIRTNLQNNSNNTRQNRSIFFRENNNLRNMINNPMFMDNEFSDHNQRRNRLHNFDDVDNLFEHLFTRITKKENQTDQQILSQLPETHIKDVTKLDPEKKNCVICLEDFKNGDKTTVLPCIHLFHTSCIKNWLKSQNNCPICKFSLTGENLNSHF